jgi:hypothetical protein
MQNAPPINPVPAQQTQNARTNPVPAQQTQNARTNNIG